MKKHLIFILLLLPLFMGQTYRTVSDYTDYCADANTIFCTRFNDDVSVAKDTSGNDTNGILTTVTYLTDGTCKEGDCYSNDATNSRISFGDLTVEATDLSFAGWFYFNDLLSDEQTILDKINSCFSFYSRVETDGSVEFYTCDSGGCVGKRTANATVVEDEWVHLAWVYDDSANDATIYKNAVAQSNSELDNTLNEIRNCSENVTLISWDDTSSDQLDGKVDEVIFLNRVLTAAEILDIYKNGLR